MFEVRNLTKHYAGIPVVDHVSFVIRRGETLGYLGPNGAGKSTTVKMMYMAAVLLLAAAAMAAMLLPARRGANSDPTEALRFD